MCILFSSFLYSQTISWDRCNNFCFLLLAPFTSLSPLLTFIPTTWHHFTLDKWHLFTCQSLRREDWDHWSKLVEWGCDDKWWYRLGCILVIHGGCKQHFGYMYIYVCGLHIWFMPVNVRCVHPWVYMQRPEEQDIGCSLYHYLSAFYLEILTEPLARLAG